MYIVTIGIPVYNSDKYITRAIESALAQTFDSIEFLICDDGCTDSSISIVEQFQKQHPRGSDIRIVHQPRNMGLGNARNRIIEEAKGEYLFHMDADDTITCNAISIMYNAAKKHNADIVYGSHERIDELNESNRTPYCYPAMCFLKDDEFASWAYRKYDGIQAMTWNFLIDVNVYRNNGLRHQLVNYWEDFSFTIDLPTYVTRVVLLPDITYYYYCREGSLSNFATRSCITKQEILRTVNAINQLKYQSDRIKNKPYFPQRMYKLMMTDFYMVATILRNRKIIKPAFTNKELVDIMKSPLTINEIMNFEIWRSRNLFLYLLGVLPPFISLFLIRIANKHSYFIKGIWLEPST